MRSKRLETIVFQQDDLITRAQAPVIGITDGALRYAVSDRGNWQVVLPGIYATFNGPLGELHRRRAAVLYGGSASMITGAVACRLYALKYVAESSIVDVLVPHRRQRGDVAFVQLHRTRHLPEPRYWLATNRSDDDLDVVISAAYEEHDPAAGGAIRKHIPLAPPARAVMDAVRIEYVATLRASRPHIGARRHARLVRDTRALLCEVVQRQKASVADLVAELNVARSPGNTIARRAMEDIVAGCRSAPECELRDLIKTSKILPEPRWNRPLPGYRPERRRDALTPDACFREARLVVEVDSVEWHRIGPRQEQTEKRRARYAELGWLVISVSPYRIRNEPDAVLRDIEQTYLAQVGRAREPG